MRPKRNRRGRRYDVPFLDTSSWSLTIDGAVGRPTTLTYDELQERFSAVSRYVPKVYESSTSVLVLPVSEDNNASGGRTKGLINLDTEAQLVVSGAISVGSKRVLGSGRATRWNCWH